MCRKAKGNEYSQRIMDELYYRPESCMINITYAGGEKNVQYSLSKRDIQTFIKRLRKHFPTKSIKYFACGEYGTAGMRPHYHMIVLGLSLMDLKCYQKFTNNPDHYHSDIINEIWKEDSRIIIGKCEPKSIYYVTGYILKASYGNQAKELYDKIGLVRPFNLMSKNMGLNYLIDHADQILKQKNIPRYYLKMIEKLNECVENPIFIKKLPEPFNKWKHEILCARYNHKSAKDYIIENLKIKEQKIKNAERKEKLFQRGDPG